MNFVSTHVDLLLKPLDWTQIENPSKVYNLQNTEELLEKGVTIYSTEKFIYLLNNSKFNVKLIKGDTVACYTIPIKPVENVQDTIQNAVPVQIDTQSTPETKPKKPRAKKAPAPKKDASELLVEPVLEEQKVEIQQ